MRQTLTHGVYLPDEGERNCYSGLASNWSILDGAVGTVAEHTSALSGKAPLVHTHVKADITDFPAYGTTAGTICEGNDSRLSDARTPVAHTHSKADITDLFNSANTWTNLQSYTQSIKFTANFTVGVAPSSDVYGGFNFGNVGTNIGNITARVSSTGTTWSRIYIGNKFTDGALDPNGTWKYAELQVGLRANGGRFIYTDCLWRSDLTPYDSNINLGNSTNKWKSFNGINPGALSLPKGYTEEGADKDYINIASAIQTLDGTAYSYTMPDNGWICVRAEQAQQLHVTLFSWYFGQSVSHPTGSTLIVSVPFRKNDQITLKVRAVTLQYARFYPMQGNV